MSRVTPIDGGMFPASMRRALRSPTYAVSYVKRRYTFTPKPPGGGDTDDIPPSLQAMPREAVAAPGILPQGDSARASVFHTADADAEGADAAACAVPARIGARSIAAASAYFILASLLLFAVTSRISSHFDIGISRVTRFTEPDRFSGNSVSALYVGTAYVNLDCAMKGIDYTVAAPINTAREFVKSLGVGIDDDDILSCPDDTRVISGMSISVDVVDKETLTQTATVPFTTETSYTQTIPRGTVNVIRPGVEGSSVQTVENTYINGELTETVILEETVTQAPVVQLAEEGSGGTVVLRGKEYRFSYYRDVEATAYGGPEFEDGHTSTGKIVDIGMIAVDPEVIPLGSRVLIIGEDGYSSYDGIYAAEDTGGFIVGDRIDVYTGSDIDVATAFGRRNMRVYILE